MGPSTTNASSCREALRGAAWVACSALAGCSLLFSFDDAQAPAPPDAATDAAVDAARDTGPVDPCPWMPIAERTHDDCICGAPCGPHRPFCCAGACCADECGSAGNDCSYEPELYDAGSLDAGWMDASHPVLADGGCDPYEHDSCLGCGVPCPDHRPFCCGAICCAQECGSFAADCSTDPDPILC